VRLDDPDGDVLAIDGERLNEALTSRAEELEALLLGQDGSKGGDGMVGLLDAALGKVAAQLAAKLGDAVVPGLLIDLAA